MIKFSFEKDKYHLQDDIRAWCRENFGSGMWMNPKGHTQTWGWETAFGHTQYYFKNELEASMFALRWS